MDMLNKDHAMPIVSLRSIARVRGGAGLRVRCVGVCYILQSHTGSPQSRSVSRHVFQAGSCDSEGKEKDEKEIQRN